MNEHLHVATDSSIYLRTNTLRLLIAACMTAFQKYQRWLSVEQVRQGGMC